MLGQPVKLSETLTVIRIALGADMVVEALRSVQGTGDNQHTRSTNPLKLPSQHTLSTHSLDTPSIHPLNTPSRLDLIPTQL